MIILKPTTINDCRKRIRVILVAVVILCVAGGCNMKTQSSNSSQVSTAETTDPLEDNVFSTPAPKTEITVALFNEILQSQRVSYEKGDGVPGSFEAFLANHPDFIKDQSSRGQVTSGKAVGNVGEPVDLMLPKGVAPENDMLNRERLARFVENYQSKVPDSIVILSSSDPIPLWITTYIYDGSGSNVTVQSCFLLRDTLEWQTSYISHGIEETDTEWILLDDPMQQHRYPKYGYEPMPLSNIIEERSESEVLEIVDNLRQSKYPETDYVVSGDPQTVDDVPCYRFDLYQTTNADSTFYTGYSFAVATDLSRYYEMEQVSGQWVLQARPKSPAID